jgi:DNA-binding beta-propeller fold protein YncE
VLDTASDSLISSIQLAAGPAMLQLSNSTGLLFASCPYDSSSFKNTIGSVAVINTVNNQLLKVIDSGFQPFGLGINEEEGVVAVANANIRSRGPTPHHVSGCGGRDGYLTYIDLKTLTVLPGIRYELAVYPFDVAAKTR